MSNKLGQSEPPPPSTPTSTPNPSGTHKNSFIWHPGRQTKTDFVSASGALTKHCGSSSRNVFLLLLLHLLPLIVVLIGGEGTRPVVST